MKYLVVVESPAKTKKIQSFLNSIKEHTFIVEASFGHIRYFGKGLKSIDVENNFKPTYATLPAKSKVVKHLKDQFKKVDEVNEFIENLVAKILLRIEDENYLKDSVYNEFIESTLGDIKENENNLNLKSLEATKLINDYVKSVDNCGKITDLYRNIE